MKQKIYLVIDDHGEPLAAYATGHEARFCDELCAYAKDYQCVNEFTHENHTWIDYEQDTTCEYGPVTNYKTANIYVMDVQVQEPQVAIAEHISRTPSPVTGIEPLRRCTECGATDGLVECFTGGGNFWCCRSCERKMREELS